MKPKDLTSLLPKQLQTEGAQDFASLKQAVLNDLREIVRCQSEVLRQMEDYPGLYAKDGNILIGKAVLATTSPKGYIYIPRCAGTTSATPSNYSAGTPMVYSTTLNKLGIYDFTSAAWRFSGVFT